RGMHDVQAEFLATLHHSFPRSRPDLHAAVGEDGLYGGRNLRHRDCLATAQVVYVTGRCGRLVQKQDAFSYVLHVGVVEGGIAARFAYEVVAVEDGEDHLEQRLDPELRPGPVDVSRAYRGHVETVELSVGIDQ